MRNDAKGRLEVQAGGWVAWSADDFPGAAWVRFVDDDGRLVPVDLVVAGDGAISANLLRQVPLGNLEARVNGSATARNVRGRMAAPGPDVRAGLRKPRKPKEARTVLLSEIALMLAPHSPGLAERGDWFYKAVANVYEDLGRITSAPTSTIAEAMGVPVSTAKAWVRKARGKEFLPPARAGKAG